MFPADSFFAEDPLNILRLFYFSSEQNLLIHPNAVQALKRVLGPR